jgi:hypothetical protein
MQIPPAVRTRSRREAWPVACFPVARGRQRETKRKLLYHHGPMINANTVLRIIKNYGFDSLTCTILSNECKLHFFKISLFTKTCFKKMTDFFDQNILISIRKFYLTRKRFKTFRWYLFYEARHKDFEGNPAAGGTQTFIGHILEPMGGW